MVDIRTPLAKAMGQHWRDENQRFEILASEVGQVFWHLLLMMLHRPIFMSQQPRPLVCIAMAITATGRMVCGGLVATRGRFTNSMPLTIMPRKFFAQVKLGRRQNSGPALGNLAFDKVSQQLFVSDLETGMIHRFDIKNRQRPWPF